MATAPQAGAKDADESDAAPCAAVSLELFQTVLGGDLVAAMQQGTRAGDLSTPPYG